jgi:hypothetical protein
MPCKVELVENRFIRLDYTGEITQDEFLGAFYDALSKSKETGVVLFIADLRYSTGGPSNFELFYKVDSYDENGVLRNMKEAVIFPIYDPESEQVKFYETICRNRGFNVRIFNDYDRGLDWLLNEQTEH